MPLSLPVDLPARPSSLLLTPAERLCAMFQRIAAVVPEALNVARAVAEVEVAVGAAGTAGLTAHAREQRGSLGVVARAQTLAVPRVDDAVCVVVHAVAALGEAAAARGGSAGPHEASVLGEDNVRTLAATFLRDFPGSFQELSSGDRANRHRIAHSMKSNARLMGAMAMSERMAELEKRLEGATGADLTPADLTAINAEFEEIAKPLRAFVGA